MFSFELPNKEKITALRARGIVPFSQFSTRLAMLAFSLFYYPKQIGGLPEVFKKIKFQEPEVYVLINQLILDIFLIPLASIVGIILLLGLLQTKFYFNPSLVFPSLERLSPLKRIKIFKFSFKVIGSLLQLPLSLLVVAILCAFSSQELLGILILKPEDQLLSLGVALTKVSQVTGFILVLLIPVSILANYLKYYLGNVMSEKDLLDYADDTRSKIRQV